jgi:hypothetical protein
MRLAPLPALLPALLLIALAAPSSADAQLVARERDIDLATFTGIIRESYPDGRPRLWKEIERGQANGRWLEWYPDGTMRFRAFWRDGKGDGRWEYFHPNGRLRSEATYAADVPIGLMREYHEHGALESERTYVNGKLHGPVTEYDPTGRTVRVQTYEYGVRQLTAPEPFAPGVIATDDNSEWGITFTPDGDTAYFTRRLANTTGQRIYRTTRTEGEWTSPEVASFSTGIDEAPFVTPDGAHLYFASARPLRRGAPPGPFDMNLWVVDRTPSGWSTPRALPPSINRTVTASTVWPANYESGPVTDSAGNLYYWSGSPTGSDADLYTAPRLPDGSFGAPRVMASPPNSPVFESGPVLSPDGQYLVFASPGRGDGLGGEDLYVSRREGDGWSVPVNLGPEVNSMAQESRPSFSPDGRYFFFSSNRARVATVGDDAPWSLYYMEAKYLLLPR